MQRWISESRGVGACSLSAIRIGRWLHIMPKHLCDSRRSVYAREREVRPPPRGRTGRPAGDEGQRAALYGGTPSSSTAESRSGVGWIDPRQLGVDAVP